MQCYPILHAEVQKHDDVTKVVEATNIAKEKYPQYLICGELQLDAKRLPEVAASKAPRSEVALVKSMNVLVFPDLDVNIGYKLAEIGVGIGGIRPITQESQNRSTTYHVDV